MTRDEQLEIVRSSVTLGTWFGHCKWSYGGYESDDQDDYYLYDHFVVRPTSLRDICVPRTHTHAHTRRIPKTMRLPVAAHLRIDFYVDGQPEYVCSRSFAYEQLEQLNILMNKAYPIDLLLKLNLTPVKAGRRSRSVRAVLTSEK